MHIRVTTIPIKGAERSQMEELANEATAILKQFPGFESATYLLNDDMSEVGVISYWDSLQQATANDDALRAAVHEDMDGYLRGEPVTKVFEVYQPQ